MNFQLLVTINVQSNAFTLGNCRIKSESRREFTKEKLYYINVIFALSVLENTYFLATAFKMIALRVISFFP